MLRDEVFDFFISPFHLVALRSASLEALCLQRRTSKSAADGGHGTIHVRARLPIQEGCWSCKKHTHKPLCHHERGAQKDLSLATEGAVFGSTCLSHIRCLPYFPFFGAAG